MSIEQLVGFERRLTDVNNRVQTLEGSLGNTQQLAVAGAIEAYEGVVPPAIADALVPVQADIDAAALLAAQGIEDAADAKANPTITAPAVAAVGGLILGATLSTADKAKFKAAMDASGVVDSTARTSIADGTVQIVAVSGALANTAADAYAYLAGRIAYAASLVGGNVGRALVRLPLGRFRTSDILAVPQGVDIEGAGAGTIIDVSGAVGRTAFVAIETTGTSISNLKIVGSGQGLQPANGTGLTIATVRDAGSGIIFAGVASGKIEGVTIEDCGGTGTTAPYRGVAAIWITHGCTKTVVTRNTIARCQIGINEDNYFGNAPNGNKITSNWITNCRFGIAIEGYRIDGGVNQEDTLVNFNTIVDTLQSAIDLNKAQRTLVIGNFIKRAGIESGNSGIWIYGTSSIPSFHVQVGMNRIFDCGKVGVGGNAIKVGSDVYYAKIFENICVGSQGYGVVILGQCRYWQVIGVHSQENVMGGFYIHRVTTDVVTTGVLQACTAYKNARHGFQFAGAAEVTVTACIAKDNGTETANTWDGFRLEEATTLCTFNGNQSSGGAQRYAMSGGDSGTTLNAFIGNILQAGGTGRAPFANLLQSAWSGNNDPVPTAAGAPTGTQLPYSALVNNPVDNRLYISTPTGYRYTATTAA